MNSITLDQAKKKLPQLINETLANCDETIIVSDNGSVVMINLDEWEAIQETLNLLYDKRALKSLLEGHHQRDRNNQPKAVSIEAAFYDLQD